jgi:hypothetical protein
MIIAGATFGSARSPVQAIEVKLHHGEKSMGQEESKSPADSERETPTLGAPIRNVETVREVKDEFGRAGATQLRAYPSRPRTRSEWVASLRGVC